MPLYLLDDHQPEWFPDSSAALSAPNGLLAAGGDLSPRRLLAAYQRGIFPWYSPGEPLMWWTPDPRCILHPERIHVSKRWARWQRQSDWQISADTCFERVIRACAAPRKDHHGTWITAEMIAAYEHLHALGFAHSIEVRDKEELVGGLYGVSLGGAFFAESMFSTRSGGSKTALLALCRQLQAWGATLIDVQMESAHLLGLGAENVPRKRFESALASALQRPLTPVRWEQAWSFCSARELVPVGAKQRR